MYIVHVHIQVMLDCIEAFKAASVENAQASMQETGVIRFDVIQQTDDVSRFVLVEVYRTPEDPARHKETDHYKKWRAIAEPMMIEPRTRTVYANLFPADEDW